MWRWILKCYAAENAVRCEATVELHGKTGVEMEALTAVQISLLTIYDMCKAVDKGMVMEVEVKRGEVGGIAEAKN